jgi:hypothetical protein
MRWRGKGRARACLSEQDVYRIYGATMHQAQLLEQVLQGHAVQIEYLQLQPMGSSAQVIPRIRRAKSMTIGRILHESRYALPDDPHALVDFARSVRNELAHDFFRSVSLSTATERRMAVGRLLAAGQLFGAATRSVYELHATSCKSVL